MLVNYSWTCRLPRSVAMYTVIICWEETGILLPSSYQLHIAPCWGMGLCVRLSCSALGFCCVWAWAELVNVVSVCEFSCASVRLCLEDAVSSESFITLALELFPAPLVHRSLNLEGRGLMPMSHLGLNAPNSLTLWASSNCRFLFIGTYRKMLLW